MRMRRYAYALAVALLAMTWGLVEAAQQRGGAPGTAPAAPAGALQPQRGGAPGGPGGAPLPPVGSMPSRRFQKIVEGVYYVTSTGSMSSGSNAVVIVNDDDVVLLDPGESPAAARAFLEDIKTITNKPVRVVIDSHYHFDHAHGNQIFGPDIMLIGSDRTYDMLAGNSLKGQAYVTQAAPELLQQRLDALKAQPPPADPQERATQQRQIAALELRIPQEREIKPAPPTTTFSTRMTLHRGSREIQLYYFGRGHSDTDIFLFLPKERIVATGDDMETGLSYLPDAWVSEWPDTLEKLLALDFDTILPGHGAPFTGKEHVRAYQSYLRDLYKQVTTFRQQGLSVEDTATRVDLRSHVSDFPQITKPGTDLRGVQRMYDLAANPNAPLRRSDSVEYPSR
jgi:cyclase